MNRRTQPLCVPAILRGHQSYEGRPLDDIQCSEAMPSGAICVLSPGFLNRTVGAVRSLMLFTIIGAMALITVTPLLASEPVLTPEDRQALLENLEETVRTGNNRDARANSALFTDDADHINPFGVACKGPKEIAAMMEQAFRDFPDWKPRCKNLETRLLTPNVALQFREWSDAASPKDARFAEKSPEFVVLVKRAGKWRMIAARPVAPYNPQAQKDLEEIPTAAGFSDPEFEKEVAGWPKKMPICEKAAVIDASGNIFRGEQISKYFETLEKGRTHLQMRLNSARCIADDVAIVDYGFADTGDWTFLDGKTAKGIYRGLWSAVFKKHDGQWTLEASRAMIPFILK